MHKNHLKIIKCIFFMFNISACCHDNTYLFREYTRDKDFEDINQSPVQDKNKHLMNNHFTFFHEIFLLKYICTKEHIVLYKGQFHQRRKIRAQIGTWHVH